MNTISSLLNFIGNWIARPTINSGEIKAETITSGTLDASRIPNLNASKIDEGTFSVDRIPNLPASKINSGTISNDRLPASAKPYDYVTQIGTSGSWSYRWWNSGRREAWCSYSGSSGSGSTWVDPIKYRDVSVNIPNNVFTSSPRVYATSYSNQSWIINANASSATAISVRLGTVSSSAFTPSIRFYCVQG